MIRMTIIRIHLVHTNFASVDSRNHPTSDLGGAREMKMQSILAAILVFTCLQVTASTSTCISALDGKVLDLRESADIVNDDFCDCMDGVDEPATSACSHLPTSMFQCRNEDALTLSIHSSRVHDGVCDCCDGTDEPDGRCANTCHIEIAKRREQAAKDLVVLKSGLAERQRRLRVLAADDAKKELDLVTHAAAHREWRALKLQMQVFLDRETRREYEMQVASAKKNQLAEDDPSDHALHPADAASFLDDSPSPPVTQPDDADVATEFQHPKVQRFLGHAVVYRQNGNWMSLRAYMHDVIESAKRTPVRTAAERRKEDFLGPLFNGGREGQVLVLTAALRGLGLVLAPVRLVVEAIWWAQYYWSLLLHRIVPPAVLRLWQQGVDMIVLDAWRSQPRLALRRLLQGRFFWWYWYTSWGVSTVWDAPVVAYNYLFPAVDTTVVLPEASSLRKIMEALDSEIAQTQRDMDVLTAVDATDYGECCRILKGTCTVAQFEVGGSTDDVRLTMPCRSTCTKCVRLAQCIKTKYEWGRGSDGTKTARRRSQWCLRMVKSAGAGRRDRRGWCSNAGLKTSSFGSKNSRRARIPSRWRLPPHVRRRRWMRLPPPPPTDGPAMNYECSRMTYVGSGMGPSSLDFAKDTPMNVSVSSRTWMAWGKTTTGGLYLGSDPFHIA
ncbi:hypothetical protein, variant 1 [Aphanomyces invadans]|uniref:Glucosidase II beta subunit N-terminal domain-containing protein n=1 Tax=Aphanomyces invadans TaxID=157072 RepID=A0A024UF91_9STRA|nr:hypothetical protein, variant 1 [Aphanomyces invadans]ETW04865.1 hypothetical protein, variant 1 [Aphanomyces invadans]|eukprot:XP_008866302.1 hypothetical protein, variant 1 [Aphanomyces invadans]